MSAHARTPACTEPWSGNLLCRRYVAVYFNQVPIAATVEAELRPVQHWAVGVHRGGESEALGTWPHGPYGAMNWRRALGELKDRGVERVRFAFTRDLAGFREDLRAMFPSATALPSFADLIDHSVSQVEARHRAPVSEQLRAIVETESGQEAQTLLDEFESSRLGTRYPALVAEWRRALEQGWALWSLTPGLRREVLSGDGKAAEFNQSLRKAIHRRGGFADADAAAAFVGAMLAREQRRLEGARVGCATELRRRR